MMICPRCQAETSSQLTFCQSCGKDAHPEKPWNVTTRMFVGPQSLNPNIDAFWNGPDQGNAELVR